MKKILNSSQKLSVVCMYFFFKWDGKVIENITPMSSTFLYNFAKLHSTLDTKCWNGTLIFSISTYGKKTAYIANYQLFFSQKKKILFRFEKERVLKFRVPVLPLIILFHFSFSVSNTISGANQQNTRHWFICLLRYAHLLVIFFK